MIVEINSQSSIPIYEQLRVQIILGIASKKILPKEALPSIRQLASDLGINLHTVNKTYSILCDEGYIIMDRRKGAVVSENVSNNDKFIEDISRTLTLYAAESLCHNISEDEFIAICRSCYKKNMNIEMEER